MSGTLTDITNGQDGVVVENKLNAQILRYNQNWRQVLALHSSGSSKNGTKWFNNATTSGLAGGGGFSLVVDYDEDTAMSVDSGRNVWTVPATGTYFISWRDIRCTFGAVGHNAHGLNAQKELGIGLWVAAIPGSAVFYRLAAHPHYNSQGSQFTTLSNYNGMAGIYLTIGTEIEFGTANLAASSTHYSYITGANLHTQGSVVAYWDVFTAQLGDPA